MNFNNAQFLPPNPMRLGPGEGNSDKFYGYISEILFFNRMLTDGERGAVASQYLNPRFDLW